MAIYKISCLEGCITPEILVKVTYSCKIQVFQDLFLLIGDNIVTPAQSPPLPAFDSLSLWNKFSMFDIVMIVNWNLDVFNSGIKVVIIFTVA